MRWTNVKTITPRVNDPVAPVCADVGFIVQITAYDETSYNHMMLMHFDPTTRQQTLYDPNNSGWVHDYFGRALTDPMWVDGHAGSRPPTGYGVDWSSYEADFQGLQTLLECTPSEPCGSGTVGGARGQHSPGNCCVSVCALVVVCCRRFGTSDLETMAGAIHNVLKSLTQRDRWAMTPRRQSRGASMANIRARLYRLNYDLTNATTYRGTLRRLGLVDVPGPQVCGAVTGDALESVPCAQPACPNEALCARHRALLGLVGPSNTTCDAPLLDPARVARHAATAIAPVMSHWMEPSADLERVVETLGPGTASHGHGGSADDARARRGRRPGGLLPSCATTRPPIDPPSRACSAKPSGRNTACVCSYPDSHPRTPGRSAAHWTTCRRRWTAAIRICCCCCRGTRAAIPAAHCPHRHPIGPS